MTVSPLHSHLAETLSILTSQRHFLEVVDLRVVVTNLDSRRHSFVGSISEWLWSYYFTRTYIFLCVVNLKGDCDPLFFLCLIVFQISLFIYNWLKGGCDPTGFHFVDLFLYITNEGGYESYYLTRTPTLFVCSQLK